MARIDNLTNFLTDVATAIKDKKGTNDTIKASDFDTEITNLPSGGSEPEKGYIINEYNSNGFPSKITIKNAGVPTYALGSYNSSSRTVISKGLTELVLPDNLSSISEGVCKYCTNLETVNFPKTLTSIGNSAFDNCKLSNVREIDFSEVTTSEKTIGTDTFAYTSIETLTIKNQSSKALELGKYCFAYNTVMTELKLIGNIRTNRGDYGFRNNTSLKKVTIDRKGYSTLTAIGTYFFNGCSALDTLIIDCDEFVINQPASSVLQGTPIASGTGYIYVPDSLVDTYKENWTNYASQIKPMGELGE